MWAKVKGSFNYCEINLRFKTAFTFYIENEMCGVNCKSKGIFSSICVSLRIHLGLLMTCQITIQGEILHVNDHSQMLSYYPDMDVLN